MKQDEIQVFLKGIELVMKLRNSNIVEVNDKFGISKHDGYVMERLEMGHWMMQ